MSNIKKIGTKVDALLRQKDKIDLANKEVKKQEEKVKKLKAKYKAMEDAIFNEFSKDELTGAAGKIARVTVLKPKVPSVTDWPKFYKYIAKTKSFDLLQRRVSNAGWKERLEAGKKVPGVKTVTLIKLSLTRVKK